LRASLLLQAARPKLQANSRARWETWCVIFMIFPLWLAIMY